VALVGDCDSDHHNFSAGVAMSFGFGKRLEIAGSASRPTCKRGVAMDIPTPSIEFLRTGWNWTLERLQIWIEMLRDPLEGVRPIDLNTTPAIVDGVQFAIFPIALTTIITLPLYLATKDQTLGFSGYLIAATFDNCGVVFFCAISQRFSAVIMRGKGGFNACLVATLYASAFLPLVGLEDYILMGQRNIYSKMMRGDLPNAHESFVLLFDTFVLWLLAVYLTIRFVPMTKYIHRVGALRAIAIVWLTMILGTVLGAPILGALETLLQIGGS
jgi:hypothetical protein